jgi:hypothetical protein
MISSIGLVRRQAPHGTWVLTRDPHHQAIGEVKKAILKGSARV